jgi:hypothetical protein
VKISKNDPQLTAYLLGELSASQMKAIENQIQNDPELKAEIDRLKSNFLQMKSLKTNEIFRLNPHQRENIFKAAGISQTSAWSKILKYSSGLVAASLALVVYVNNSGNLKNSATSKVANLQASAPALSEMAEAPSTKVVARAESRPMMAKKAITTEQESEDSALAIQTRGAPAPAEMAYVREEKIAKDSAQTIEKSKGSFSAGEVGAADMSQNKMRLLDASQARKKELVTDEVLASAPVSQVAAEAFGSVGGSGAVAVKASPSVSKQLYDLESKSSQPDIYTKIADPIFKCFDTSLSQYVKYDVAWNLTWSAKLGNVTSFSSEIIDNGTESLKNPRQNFSAEIICAEQAIRQAFKTLPPSQNENTFKYRLILKSK